MIEIAKVHNPKVLMTILAAMIAVLGVFAVTAFSGKTASAQGYWEAKCGAGFQLKKVYEGDYGGANGEVRVFTKDTGYNTDWCAMTIHEGATWGKSLDTFIDVVGYNGAYSDPSYSVHKDDKNYYSYYAGPVRVYNTQKLRVYGDIRGPDPLDMTVTAKYLSN